MKRPPRPSIDEHPAMRELENLVREGIVVRRRREDGQWGYWLKEDAP